jgi:hypothetical protein
LNSILHLVIQDEYFNYNKVNSLGYFIIYFIQIMHTFFFIVAGSIHVFFNVCIILLCTLN